MVGPLATRIEQLPHRYPYRLLPSPNQAQSFGQSFGHGIRRKRHITIYKTHSKQFLKAAATQSTVTAELVECLKFWTLISCDWQVWKSAEWKSVE
mmetsp:Transcript_14235/g.33228  ORF Transcript_14235/g.33228 Transcript_14235/m.33228 type:complete len:95 (+) Transcript_14235:57-341(+)